MYVDRWYQTAAVESIGGDYTAAANGEKHDNPLIGLPTGTGKSLVIARAIQKIVEYFPWHRGIVLTHVKELIAQNSKKLLDVWPTAPVGVCSAGLNKRDTAQPIIFGGIGTIVNRVGELGHRDYVFIDEAHLVGDKEDAMYIRTLNAMREVNPNLIVIGLSATLYRMKMGKLTDNGIFNKVAFDLTNVDGFNRLLAEGYIAPLIPQPTETTLDTSEVKKSGGEFQSGSLEEAVDKDHITRACCAEMVAKASDRRCWIVFASGVKHAEHIAEILNQMGVPSAAVHSKKKGNDKIIEAFKRGEIRCLVNYGKLTTGFDHPPIDFIGMMRPTLSPGLWVQMLGRGTRPYDGRYANQYIIGFEYIKGDCLVLDFAGNALRLGPINDPVLPRKPGEKTGDVPIKICEGNKLVVNEGLERSSPGWYLGCNTFNHASARFCAHCKFEFKMGGVDLMTQSGTAALIKIDAPPQVDYIDVSHVLYSRIAKSGVPPMMKVSYICGIREFSEIICLEHQTAARHFARDWWRQRFNGEPPATTDEGLMIARSGALPQPRRIKVWVNKLPYPEVLSHEY